MNDARSETHPPLDSGHPDANMYGCLPCPKCKSVQRWPTQQGAVQCDECGLSVPLKVAWKIEGDDIDIGPGEPGIASEDRTDAARSATGPIGGVA